MQNTYDLFIDNERVQTAGQERFAAINPYTREEWASVPQASAAQVADAIAAARHAYDTVWRKTHRLGGRLFVIAGLLMFLTPFLPASLTTVAILAAIIGAGLVPVVYSFLAFRQEQAAKNGSAG